jgi:asparagine synthase (glutamine-hydrolysing)
LIRGALAFMNKGILPDDVILRTKEAFSDGVSGENRSWYTIIGEFVENKEISIESFTHNPPTTKEQQYYRMLFEEYYPGCGEIVPYFWMPKWVETNDPSARTIKIKNE